MTSHLAPEAPAPEVVALLKRATSDLHALQTSENPLLAAVNALDDLLAAVRNLRAPLADISEISALLFAAAPRIAEAAASKLTTEDVHFGLGCGAGLLSSFGDAFHTDRLLYAALLLADLKAILFRAEIARRGDPLAQIVAARMRRPSDGQTTMTLQ